MIWFIIVSFLSFDGWTHQIPIYNDPPYRTMESCQEAASSLEGQFSGMWPDRLANVREIKVDCYTARPYGT